MVDTRVSTGYFAQSETDAVALAFSTADRPSFETIKAWRAKIESAGDELAMVLVQNKIDLAHQAAVST